MENKPDNQAIEIFMKPLCSKDGGVKIRLEGCYHNGNEVNEEYFAYCYFKEKEEYSGSYRINQQNPEYSSVNIMRVNDRPQSIHFFMGFWFDGQSYRDPHIDVETNLWFDKYRKIRTNFYLCSGDELTEINPIKNLVFNRQNRRLSGSFKYHPLGHQNVVVSGEFDVRIKVI
jgi:hypothetical protein